MEILQTNVLLQIGGRSWRRILRKVCRRTDDSEANARLDLYCGHPVAKTFAKTYASVEPLIDDVHERIRRNDLDLQVGICG